MSHQVVISTLNKVPATPVGWLYALLADTMLNCTITVQEYPQETVPETGGEKDNQDRLKVRPPEGQEEEGNDSSQQEEEGGTSNTTSAVG